MQGRAARGSPSVPAGWSVVRFLLHPGAFEARIVLAAQVQHDLVGPFADRYNKKLLVIGGSLAAAVLSFFLKDMTDTTGLLLVMVPIAVMTSLARAAASAYSVEVGNELKSMGACMGLSNAMQDLGMFTGPILYGWVSDTFGLTATFYTGAFAGLIAVPLMIWALYGKDTGQEVVLEVEPVKAGSSGNGSGT